MTNKIPFMLMVLLIVVSMTLLAIGVFIDNPDLMLVSVPVFVYAVLQYGMAEAK